jgi:hypothetical protein
LRAIVSSGAFGEQSLGGGPSDATTGGRVAPVDALGADATGEGSRLGGNEWVGREVATKAVALGLGTADDPQAPTTNPITMAAARSRSTFTA